MELVGQCDKVYLLGDSKVRRLSNQAFFRQLRLRDEEVEESRNVGAMAIVHYSSVVARLRSATEVGAKNRFEHESSNNDYLVRPGGLEPPNLRIKNPLLYR